MPVAPTSARLTPGVFFVARSLFTALLLHAVCCNGAIMVPSHASKLYVPVLA
jgi:hypothetical protein